MQGARSGVSRARTTTDAARAGISQLVARVLWRMSRMRRVEAMPCQVPGDVGAHEIDAEEAEVGLELEREEADVGDLADVIDKPLGERCEVLAPAGRVVGRQEVRMRAQDGRTCRRRHP